MTFVSLSLSPQFDRFKEILADIVRGYDAQAPRRNRSIAGAASLPFSTSTISSPPSSSPNPSTVLTVHLPGWDPAAISPATVDAEGEFLWLIYIYLQKEVCVHFNLLILDTTCMQWFNMIACGHPLSYS